MSSEKDVREDLRKLHKKVPAYYHLYMLLQFVARILTNNIQHFFYARTCQSYHCDVNKADRKRASGDYNEVIIPYNSSVKYSTKIHTACLFTSRLSAFGC